jgi:hypothetical protein
MPFREGMMPLSGNTGGTVPAWVRERIVRYEEDWPAWVTAVAMAGADLVLLVLGMMLWFSDARVFYAP